MDATVSGDTMYLLKKFLVRDKLVPSVVRQMQRPLFLLVVVLPELQIPDPILLVSRLVLTSIKLKCRIWHAGNDGATGNDLGANFTTA